ncbi:DUF2726 domain-containing protein [Halomonas sp. PAMB 3232]|uniref:DUF2726 domain-containing protein n=1 Tax=Halomonas sp. PAMB 3232 TaxID=3075221 RepID=UPI00289BB827|nr:DUF2726 domain-containing protein [Halomonas sp. PAMB 3232]WNL39528.1 DUF2726 domain-containing protein [Halomonas sp. PAMB 3232]
MDFVNATALLWPAVLWIPAIFVFVVLMKLMLAGLSSKRTGSISDRKTSRSQALLKKGGAYHKKGALMSPSEQDVYRVLVSTYGAECYIFAQVRVVDVIEPNSKKYRSKSSAYLALFRQISQWHFDYVICSKEDFSILYVMELDDPSHERPDRQRRDRILESVCADAGVELKRMWLDYRSRKIKVHSSR